MRHGTQRAMVTMLVALLCAALLVPASMAVVGQTQAAPHNGCRHHLPPAKSPVNSSSLMCCIGHDSALPVAAFASPALPTIAISINAPAFDAQGTVRVDMTQCFHFLPPLVPLRI
jgi:hypothetical protein